jgi:hypothetical protein
MLWLTAFLVPISTTFKYFSLYFSLRSCINFDHTTQEFTQHWNEMHVSNGRTEMSILSHYIQSWMHYNCILLNSNKTLFYLVVRIFYISSCMLHNHPIHVHTFIVFLLMLLQCHFYFVKASTFDQSTKHFMVAYKMTISFYCVYN